MIPGDNQIYLCFKCYHLVTRGSIHSGNTFRAIIYSDGKLIAPMLPQFPSITKCPQCGHIFWLDLTNWMGSEERSNRKRQKKLDKAQWLTVPDYFVALQNGLAKDKDQELWLRTLLWWTYNDRYRKGSRPFTYEQEDEEFDRFMFADPNDVFNNHRKDIFEDSGDEIRWLENCQRLKSLVNKDDLKGRRMLAELERNLGNFDRCEQIIKEIDDKDLFGAKAKLLDACKNKHRWVIRLK